MQNPCTDSGETTRLFDQCESEAVSGQSKETPLVIYLALLAKVARVHSILDIGVICFILWTGPDLKISPFERVLKNLLDTGPWD